MVRVKQSEFETSSQIPSGKNKTYFETESYFIENLGNDYLPYSKEETREETKERRRKMTRIFMRKSQASESQKTKVEGDLKRKLGTGYIPEKDGETPCETRLRRKKLRRLSSTQSSTQSSQASTQSSQASSQISILDPEFGLVTNEWITDDIIDVAATILKQQFPLVAGFEKASVGRVAFAVQVDTNTEGMQFHHINGCHWVLSSTMGGLPIKIYDSLPSESPSRDLIHQLTNLYFPGEVSAEEVVQIPVQRQEGAQDCGIFAICFAVSLLHGQDVSRLRYDQSKMRSHLITCLQKKKITPFPLTCNEKENQVPNSFNVSSKKSYRDVLKGNNDKENQALHFIDHDSNAAVLERNRQFLDTEKSYREKLGDKYIPFASGESQMSTKTRRDKMETWLVKQKTKAPSPQEKIVHLESPANESISEEAERLNALNNANLSSKKSYRDVLKGNNENENQAPHFIDHGSDAAVLERNRQFLDKEKSYRDKLGEKYLPFAAGESIWRTRTRRNQMEAWLAKQKEKAHCPQEEIEQLESPANESISKEAERLNALNNANQRKEAQRQLFDITNVPEALTKETHQQRQAVKRNFERNRNTDAELNRKGESLNLPPMVIPEREDDADRNKRRTLYKSKITQIERNQKIDVKLNRRGEYLNLPPMEIPVAEDNQARNRRRKLYRKEIKEAEQKKAMEEENPLQQCSDPAINVEAFETEWETLKKEFDYAAERPSEKFSEREKKLWKACDEFTTKQKNYIYESCEVCHEINQVAAPYQVYQDLRMCPRCRKDDLRPRLFSAENNMIPADQPEVTSEIRQIQKKNLQ